MPLLSAPTLTRFAAEILAAAGVPADKAGIAAEGLIASNLRGVDSHGLQLLPFYIEQILAGEMDPKADGQVISESGSCLVFDAQNAIGQWVAHTCCGHAIRLAATHGAGVVVARESNHFGAAAWWAQKMRAAGRLAASVAAGPISATTIAKLATTVVRERELRRIRTPPL